MKCEIDLSYLVPQTVNEWDEFLTDAKNYEMEGRVRLEKFDKEKPLIVPEFEIYVYRKSASAIAGMDLKNPLESVNILSDTVKMENCLREAGDFYADHPWSKFTPPLARAKNVSAEEMRDALVEAKLQTALAIEKNDESYAGKIEFWQLVDTRRALHDKLFDLTVVSQRAQLKECGGLFRWLNPSLKRPHVNEQAKAQQLERLKNLEIELGIGDESLIVKACRIISALSSRMYSQSQGEIFLALLDMEQVFKHPFFMYTWYLVKNYNFGPNQCDPFYPDIFFAKYTSDALFQKLIQQTAEQAVEEAKKLEAKEDVGAEDVMMLTRLLQTNFKLRNKYQSQIGHVTACWIANQWFEK